MTRYILLILWVSTFYNLKTAAQDKKPNVLLILVDDLKPTLGAYGDTVAHSPNIDQLAAEGMRFDMAYCNQAVCAPSRYNLMLGARSTSTGLFNFGNEFRDIYPDAITLPQHFKNAGYHTESMGKVYHIGHGNDNDVDSWSIPHHKEKVIEYISPESTDRQLTREEAYFENTRLYFDNIPKHREIPRGAAWEEEDVLDEAYADGRVSRHAIDRLRILKKQPEKPFFMALGFARPHLPFSVPKKYWDMYDPSGLPMPEFEDYPKDGPRFAVKRGGEISNFRPIPEQEKGIYADSLKRKLIHGYYASLSYMDAQLGKVIDELKRLEMYENTIIVLWGDHGWHLGDHGIWTKHTNYEQANRIPLIIVAPNITAENTSTEHLAETVDVYPTLSELAGLARPIGPQPIDGLSLLPVLKNGNARIRDYAYHAFNRGGYLGEAIRTKRYRLIRWKNLKKENDYVYELYDYKEDESETVNIASSQEEVVKRLTKILDSLPEAKSKPSKG